MLLFLFSPPPPPPPPPLPRDCSPEFQPGTAAGVGHLCSTIRADAVWRARDACEGAENHIRALAHFLRMHRWTEQRR